MISVFRKKKARKCFELDLKESHNGVTLCSVDIQGKSICDILTITHEGVINIHCWVSEEFSGIKSFVGHPLVEFAVQHTNVTCNEDGDYVVIKNMFGTDRHLKPKNAYNLGMAIVGCATRLMKGETNE